MKTYSISNLSQREYNDLLVEWKKRRKLFYLLSLLIIPAPFTISAALFCNNNINYLISGGKRTSNFLVLVFHLIIGVMTPIIIVPIYSKTPIGYLVLGSRIVD